MKPTKYVKKNTFKEFFKESWTVYLVVCIVLMAIGILYSSLSGEKIVYIILGIIFVASFMMLIEFLIWKKKN